MSEFPELKIQKKIYEFIAKNPGIPLRKIADVLNFEMSYIERYIFYMLENGEIFTSQNAGFTVDHVEGSKRFDRRTQDTRQAICTLIKKNPGLHLSKIAEMLNMRTSLAEYHLLYMERENTILSIKEDRGYYKRFYLKDFDLGAQDKKILALLRHKSLLKIALILIKNPRLKHKELSMKLKLSPSTLSYHLNILLENDIIDVFHYGKEKGYSLKNEKELLWIIRKYKLGVLIEGFKDVWDDLTLR